MPQPKLTGPVHVFPDHDALFESLGDALLNAAREAVDARGAFHLALSGGSGPVPFFMRLMTDLRYRALPWEKTHVWQVDERRVPDDDERRNYKMLRETILDHIPTPQRHKHPMRVMEDGPDRLYEAELREVFGLADGLPRMDFVQLGMGEDCHTASLFPHSPALTVADRLVAVNAGEQVTPPDRVTMTYPLLNAARSLAVLVTGAKKAAPIRRIEKQLADAGPDPATLPITGVAPTDGAVSWYLDAAAAAAE